MTSTTSRCRLKNLESCARKHACAHTHATEQFVLMRLACTRGRGMISVQDICVQLFDDDMRHTRTCALERTHAHTHTHTNTHARTHTRTHAHTHTCRDTDWICRGACDQQHHDGPSGDSDVLVYSNRHARAVVQQLLKAHHCARCVLVRVCTCVRAKLTTVQDVGTHDGPCCTHTH